MEIVGIIVCVLSTLLAVLATISVITLRKTIKRSIQNENDIAVNRKYDIQSDLAMRVKSLEMFEKADSKRRKDHNGTESVSGGVTRQTALAEKPS